MSDIDQTTEILAKRERQRLLANARAKKSYNTHKAKKVEYMRAKRLADKQQYDIVVDRMAILSHREQASDPQQTPEPEQAPEPPPLGVKLQYTKEQCLALLASSTLYNESTKSTYRSDINRLFKITSCDSGLAKCFRNPKKMMKEILDSKFAVNTIKQTLQVVVILVDKLHMLDTMAISEKNKKESLDLFKHRFGEYKELSNEENTAKQNDPLVYVPTFTEYLQLCETKFGKTSKEYVVALLYSFFTVRDNYADMKLIESTNDSDGVNNFLVLDTKTRTTKITILINNYKTQKQYQKMQFEVTNTNLKTALFNWISQKKLKYGDTIFGKTALSPFLSKMHKKLGYMDNVGGVNFFRHMRVSELYAGENKTFTERKALADSMGHSLLTAKRYQRNLKVM